MRNWLAYTQLILTVALIVVLLLPTGQLLSLTTQLFNVVVNVNKNTDRNFEQMIRLENKSDEARVIAQNDRNVQVDKIISFMSLYLCEIEQDVDKLKAHHNVTDGDRVVNNGTHIIVDNTHVLPLPVPCITSNQTVVP